jgi:hypothetical protein
MSMSGMWSSKMVSLLNEDLKIKVLDKELEEYEINVGVEGEEILLVNNSEEYEINVGVEGEEILLVKNN